MSENLCSTTVRGETARAVERVYFERDRAWSSDDLDAMIVLYSPDAMLESPLIPYMQGGGVGILKGREEISSTRQRRESQASGLSIVAATSRMGHCWFGSTRERRRRASR